MPLCRPFQLVDVMILIATAAIYRLNLLAA
jgi:hypothetical protein